MRKITAIVVSMALLAVSCSNYGTKVKINDKSEVYYKGEGVTEADAKSLGDFLLKNNYFDNNTEKSVQLTKVADTFNVKFVVDEEKVKALENADGIFQLLGMMISATVFNQKPVKVILADKYMEPFRELASMEAGEDDAAADTSTVSDSTAVQ